MEAARKHIGIARERLMQRLRRGDALDVEFAKCALHPADGGGAILVPDDELAEQRVIERRHRVARIQHAIEAHAIATGHAEA